MTKEQCREAGATMIAWADGKSIQYRQRDQSEWFDIEPACTATILSWDWDEFEYRVKPMPKLRPWTEGEVPLGAIIRYKNNSRSIRLLIVCSDEYGLTGTGSHWPYKVLLENTEHSLDGGKTWLPCGVEESK